MIFFFKSHLPGGYLKSYQASAIHVEPFSVEKEMNTLFFHIMKANSSCSYHIFLEIPTSPLVVIMALVEGLIFTINIALGLHHQCCSLLGKTVRKWKMSLELILLSVQTEIMV